MDIQKSQADHDLENCTVRNKNDNVIVLFYNNNINGIMKQFSPTILVSLLSITLFACNSDQGNDVATSPEAPVLPETPGTPDEDCLDCGWDIEQWKLTLPISKDNYYGSGGDGAAELISAECSGKETLDDDTTLPYYWTSKNDQELVFKVDMGGDGATTTNSNYVRSELRELFNYETENKCSASNQNWAITGTHKLNANLEVQQFPDKSITGSDPKVIVGQVHGYQIKQALIKLLWEGENKPVRAIFNDSFSPDNNTCSSCNSFSIDLGTVAADTSWDYQINVDQNGIEVTTTIDGVTNSTKKLLWGEQVTDSNGKTYTMSEHWRDETYYFKAGIYPQIKPDPDYANQAFQVAFKNIQISH